MSSAVGTFRIRDRDCHAFGTANCLDHFRPVAPIGQARGVQELEGALEKIRHPSVRIWVHLEVDIGSVVGHEHRLVDDPADVAFRHLHVQRFDVVRCQPDASVRAETVDAERRIRAMNADASRGSGPASNLPSGLLWPGGTRVRTRFPARRISSCMDSGTSHVGFSSLSDDRERSKRCLPVAATDGNRIVTLKTSVGEHERAGAAER